MPATCQSSSRTMHHNVKRKVQMLVSRSVFLQLFRVSTWQPCARAKCHKVTAGSGVLRPLTLSTFTARWVVFQLCRQAASEDLRAREASVRTVSPQPLPSVHGRPVPTDRSTVPSAVAPRSLGRPPWSGAGEVGRSAGRVEPGHVAELYIFFCICWHTCIYMSIVLFHGIILCIYCWVYPIPCGPVDDGATI